MYISTKGISRQFRKALASVGKPFPLHGAFHVVDKDGIVVPPNRISERVSENLTVHAGPISMMEQFVAVNTYIDKLVGPPTHFNSPLPPALKSEAKLPNSECVQVLPVVYKRVVRVGDYGKRTDYRMVKNPKAGQTYFYKPADSKKYVEIEYSTLLRKEGFAA